MAIKGEMIDITKPENYLSPAYGRIIAIEESGDKLKVNLEGAYCVYYTKDGFYIPHGDPAKDLIFDPQETKKRKVVSFKIMQGFENGRTRFNPGVFCLTDDGEIYLLNISTNDSKKVKWMKLPGIPQD